MKDLRISSLNDIYADLLTSRQSGIIKHYYDYDLSYGEISEIFGITRQAIGQIIEAAKRQLENFENSLGLFGVQEQLKLLKAEIRDEKLIERLENIIRSIGSTREDD